MGEQQDLGRCPKLSLASLGPVPGLNLATHPANLHGNRLCVVGERMKPKSRASRSLCCSAVSGLLCVEVKDEVPGGEHREESARSSPAGARRRGDVRGSEYALRLELMHAPVPLG